MFSVKQTAGMDVCNLDASTERNTDWRERREERGVEEARERGGGELRKIVQFHCPLLPCSAGLCVINAGFRTPCPF